MTRATRYGKPLPSGGCIGVPAPASAYFNRSEVLRGVEWWESNGYRVKLADGVFDRDDYVAGDPKARASDLMAMFEDDEVDLVHCLQGGFGSAQLLPYLDFDVIAANPKPLAGFSDITALHTALRQRAGLATFLVQLTQSGKLDGVAGVVVGELEKCDWREERPEWPRTRSVEDVLEERLEPLGVPVLYKLPLGHGKHLATIPLGVVATLDGDARTLTIDEAALRPAGAAAIGERA